MLRQESSFSNSNNLGNRTSDPKRTHSSGDSDNNPQEGVQNNELKVVQEESDDNEDNQTTSEFEKTHLPPGFNPKII